MVEQTKDSKQIIKCAVCGDPIPDGEKPKKALCDYGNNDPVHIACHWRCKSCPDRKKRGSK